MKTSHPLILALAAGVAAIGVSTLRASDLDSRIESAANNSYVFKTYLHDDSVKTTSKDGVVTLTGTVADESRKTLAENTVSELPGVKSVDNELEVKAPYTAMYSDAWVETKVKTALLFHRHVSATGTTVAVRDGLVTLGGRANSLAQKDLTTEYARDVAGVKDVSNLMTVAVASVDTVPEPVKTGRTLGQVIDDASVTAEARLSLATHRSTSALNTRVQTRYGVVTLSGVAKNPAERDLVTRLITDIDGVKTVVNDMAVNNSGTTE